MVNPFPRRILNVRKHLSADGLYALLCTAFRKIPDHRREGSPIPLVDTLMSAFAMFALKDPSLLAFEERRNDENMRNLFRIRRLPCDTRCVRSWTPWIWSNCGPCTAMYFGNCSGEKLWNLWCF